MQTRILAAIALLGALSGGLHAAGGGGGLKFASADPSDARKMVGELTRVGTPAAMWIWSDKYVYEPGQQLTLKWTLKPNGDLYPYTIVAYRQNNQTGEKSYLPGGGSQATDIFGRTPGQGFDLVRLPEAEKAVLTGDGGMFPAVTIPAEFGMHTIVVQLRDYTGTRIIKSAYWKFGVVEGFENLPNDVVSDLTLVNTKAYRLSGVMLVHDGATLNIEPGTFVIGQPGSQPPSSIIIGNDGKIMAAGTRSRPIVMTSSLPFGQRRAGDWGGLVMLGKAPNNWPGGQGNIEGLPPSEDTVYGGDDPTHDCGTIRYVRLEFSGAELGPNDEINTFTWGSCGTDTVSEYLQAHFGLDDSFEWFGGTNNGRYLVSTYARDDHFDGQIGWRGKVQFGVAYANLNNTNRGIEMDNNETDFGASPLGDPKFYNITFVGTGDVFPEGVDEAVVSAVYLRRGAAGSYNNMLLYNWAGNGIILQHDATLANIPTGSLNMNGVLMWRNGEANGRPNTIAGQVSSNAVNFINDTPNVLLADPMLRRPFEFSDPDFRPATGSPVFRADWIQPPDDGFFDQSATFIGAFGEEDWTEEWTMFMQEEDF